MADPKAAVAAMYQAFSRGDVPAILAHLAPDVRWEEWPDNSAQKAGVPFMQFRSGHDGAAGFFQLLGTYKFHKFDVLAILSDEKHAAGVVSLEIELPNGNRIIEEEMHLFTFNADGKVTAFRHYLDTAKAITAFQTRV